MQSMVPNPMYANIGLHPGFEGTQGQFGVSQGNLGMAGFSIPPVNMTPRHQHVTGQGVQMAPTGFGRAVSDGAFIATICDVAVDPAYQRRGIGRRIVKELVKTMKQSEGPSGFAVFPPPKARLFFWSIGFRPDRNYRFMTYRGKLLDSSVQDEDNLDPE
ncbi:hypothetical protein L7F22_045441 [Adiantum nelumboides]|nr:hypothetical protein [Adiantum nelumboides]